MTARFDRLSMVDHLMLVGLLSVVATLNFPATADATASNKTDSVFEIKNIQTITIPESITIPGIDEIHKFVFGTPENELVADSQIPTIQISTVELTPSINTQPILAKKEVKLVAKKTGYNIPPKATNKVYMHEPEIREYLCSKLGDNCNTFIAILKAENGTHECTRDNRGLNRNGSVDIGLAQINWTPSSPYSFEQLQDCKFNLDIAMKKYDSRGFRPWYAYTSGKYKKHLPAVIAAAANIQ